MRGPRAYRLTPRSSRAAAETPPPRRRRRRSAAPPFQNLPPLSSSNPRLNSRPCLPYQPTRCQPMMQAHGMTLHGCVAGQSRGSCMAGRRLLHGWAAAAAWLRGCACMQDARLCRTAVHAGACMGLHGRSQWRPARRRAPPPVVQRPMWCRPPLL